MGSWFRNGSERPGIPDEIDFLVDLLINSVNGCMLAQQQVDIAYHSIPSRHP